MTMLSRLFLSAAIAILSVSCATSDSSLREQGRSDAYVVGYHDDFASSTGAVPALDWFCFVFHESAPALVDYRQGWLDGEVEGKKIQAQAEAVGNAAAGSYSGYRLDKEVEKTRPDAEKIAKDAMKDVDTDALKALEK